MLDFASLLDRVASRKVREQLVEHIASYEHTEFGHDRPLAPDEMALILNVVDTFLRGRSLTKWHVPEIEAVCERLNECARQEDVPSPSHYIAFRDACFDGMACIKALEARVLGVADREEVG